MSSTPLLDFGVVDAHFHLWRPSRLPYAWLEPGAPDPPTVSFAPLRRDVRYADYAASVGAVLDVAAGIHVEAGCDDPQAETAFIAEEAGRHRPVGHVARVSLERGAQDVGSALAHPAVRGARMRLNADPRINPGGEPADTPRYDAAFQALSEAGTVFDLSVFPDQTAETERLVRRWPELSFALNHLGWPRIEAGHDDIDTWRAMIRTLSRCPNLTIKLSMLSPIDRAWRVAPLRPFVREALDAFGPERMMWGSNYPIETLFGEPRAQIETLLTLLHDLDEAALAAVFGCTASRVYRLTPERSESGPSDRR